MRVVPITRDEANAFVAQHHRHSRPVKGCRFALGALLGGELIGVAIVGRPVARLLNDRTTAEVRRLCVREGAPKGACSFLYGACRRVWQSMGGLRLVTYTLQSESGESLTGAGWERAAEVPARKPGRHFNSRQREREWSEIYAQPKFRWEAPQ